MGHGIKPVIFLGKGKKVEMCKNLNIIFMSAILLVTLLFSLFMFVRDNWYSREVSPLPKPEEFVLQDLKLLTLPNMGEVSPLPKKEPVLQDLTSVNKESGTFTFMSTDASTCIMSAGSLVIQPVQTLAIACGTGTITIYFSDGRVEISDGISLPEASTVFWNAIGNAFGEFKQAIIAEHEKEKKE